MVHFGYTEAMIIIGEEIWTVPLDSNNLIAVNIFTGVTRLIIKMPVTPSQRLFSTIIKHGSKLYFVPLSSEALIILDLQTLKTEAVHIDVPEKNGDCKYNELLKFCSACIFGEYIYLFSCCFPAFVKMSLNTLNVEYFTEWLEEIEEHRINLDEVYFRSLCLYDNMCVLPSCCSNVLAIFDIKSEKCEIRVVGDDIYSNVYVDGEKYYLSSKSGKNLICFSNGILTSIPNTKAQPSTAMYSDGEHLIVISISAKESYRLSLDDNRKEDLNLKTNRLFGAICDGKHVYTIGSRLPELIKIPISPGGTIEYKKLRFYGGILYELLKKHPENDVVFFNEEELGLDYYLKLV